jgi:hypothetical protein
MKYIRIYGTMACISPATPSSAQSGACIGGREHRAESAYLTCMQRGGIESKCWEVRMDTYNKCKELYKL